MSDDAPTAAESEESTDAAGFEFANGANGSDESTDPDGVEAHTTDRRSLSSRVQIHWGIRMLVGVVLLTLGASYLGILVDPVPPWFGAAVGVVLLSLGVAWVHLRYRVWAYEVRADSLYLERGVFTHVRTIAPYVRIQHVDTQRGPLERWLGLSTLVVYTAGTRGADVSVPGLTTAEARDLQERVKQLAIEAEGGDAV